MDDVVSGGGILLVYPDTRLHAATVAVDVDRVVDQSDHAGMDVDMGTPTVRTALCGGNGDSLGERSPRTDSPDSLGHRGPITETFLYGEVL